MVDEGVEAVKFTSNKVELNSENGPSKVEEDATANTKVEVGAFERLNVSILSTNAA